MLKTQYKSFTKAIFRADISKNSIKNVKDFLIQSTLDIRDLPGAA